MLSSALPVISALLAPSAGASEFPTIAVVGLHQAELTTEDQRRSVDEIAKAIEASGRFDALTGDDVIRTIQGREKIILEDGLLAGARQDLANGKNAYNQASPEDAVAYLEAAIDEFRFGIAATNTVEELWEAWLYLGTSHLMKDPPDEVASRTAFVNAIAISPSRPLNPALFPPNVVEAFDRVKAEMALRLTTLTITISPPVTTGSTIRVWVDGVDRGPAAKVDVFPGEHHVLVRGDGTQGYARVEVPIPESGAPPPSSPAVQAVDLTLDLPTLGEAATSPVGRSGQIAALYTAFGNRAEGVDYVLVAGTDGSTLHLQLLDPQTDTFSKAMEVPFAGPADDEAVASVPLLLNIVDQLGRFTASAPTPAPIPTGTNSVLALLLTQPRAVSIAVVQPPKPPKPPKPGNGTDGGGGGIKTGVWLGIVGGVVAAGAASGTIYALTRPGEGPTTPTQQGPGTIVVQF